MREINVPVMIVGPAILARPDNHVGWRSINAVADPGVELTTALSHVVGGHT